MSFTDLNWQRIGILTLGIAASCSGPEKTPDTELPNIIIILADDMGFSDLGYYGSEIATPNLDNLAKQGQRFTQMHNTSKCFPSRACLMTGLYAQQCNMSVSNADFRNAVTFGEVLKTAGYRTFMVGKHHGTDNPYDRGFDRYFGLRDGTCNYFNPGEQREGEPVPAHKLWAKPRIWCIDSAIYSPYTPPQKDFYTTDYFTDYALDYLEEYKDENKPFFLYAAYNAPHDPLHAWPADIQKYIGKYRKGYEEIRQNRYKKQLESGLIDSGFPLSDPMYIDWNGLTEEEKITEDSLMATYAAMIDRLDQNIGRIINWLKENNKYNNTLIMFMSDNGCQPNGPGTNTLNETAGSYPIGTMGRYSSISRSWANVGNTPFRYYKNWSYEGGTCTPFIVSWPDRNPEFVNAARDFPSHFIDIMPTLIEITGAHYPEEFNGERIFSLPGVSLLSAWKGEVKQRKGAIYWQWAEGKAIRENNFKLVYGKNGDWNLYNMNIDKTETNNILNNNTYKYDYLIKKFNIWMDSISGNSQ